MLARLSNTKALHWLGRQLLNRDNPAGYFDPLAEAINPMWVQEYTPARVENIIDETADTKTFVLKPAKRWAGFQAGQHVNICTDIEGVRRTRTFSLSSSPLLWQSEGQITLTIKRLPGGLVTNWMHDALQPGDVIGLTEAFGEFLIPEPAQPVLFIAGGSGITPILSQLQTMAAEDYRAPVTLLYYVRTQNDVIAREALQALAARWPALSLTIIATNESDEPRYLRDSDLETVAGIKAREVFLCGPKGLMDLATDLLTKRGLKEKQMHSTFFAPPAQASLDSDQLGGEVTFSNSNLKVGSEGDANLLEIAEAAGLKPQYGCRMGICHQCSCRKTSGIVVNRLTGKVSGPGEEPVQLCVSVPQGPVALDV
ncbi:MULTISPECIES: ferredoxin reductase [unclassified Marinobacter]|jgi:ferredoxin-NADP reductase|uniref:ferredoxin reductase n=1 Tax=unclassified Marinobacter TaxID=83889 RepID=UPI0012679037|nr:MULTISPECIES: ferredoxin reductase [unclassified Marinobacter]QFS88176.1 Stearoyl-CoA 9-desaturase electron transfer partner [Marinobacter sp. THAF197a]QFT51961.1 Stearoyl-CoA 9-desaturase electron transfer partner [Marinobacter sp. THAF39]